MIRSFSYLARSKELPLSFGTGGAGEVGLVCITSGEVADAACPAGTFAVVYVLTALTVARGLLDTETFWHSLSGGGAV